MEREAAMARLRALHQPTAAIVWDEMEQARGITWQCSECGYAGGIDGCNTARALDLLPGARAALEAVTLLHPEPAPMDADAVAGWGGEEVARLRALCPECNRPAPCRSRRMALGTDDEEDR